MHKEPTSAQTSVKCLARSIEAWRLAPSPSKSSANTRTRARNTFTCRGVHEHHGASCTLLHSRPVLASDPLRHSRIQHRSTRRLPPAAAYARGHANAARARAVRQEHGQVAHITSRPVPRRITHPRHPLRSRTATHTRRARVASPALPRFTPP